MLYINANGSQHTACTEEPWVVSLARMYLTGRTRSDDDASEHKRKRAHHAAAAGAGAASQVTEEVQEQAAAAGAGGASEKKQRTRTVRGYKYLPWSELQRLDHIKKGGQKENPILIADEYVFSYYDNKDIKIQEILDKAVRGPLLSLLTLPEHIAECGSFEIDDSDTTNRKVIWRGSPVSIEEDYKLFAYTGILRFNNPTNKDIVHARGTPAMLLTGYKGKSGTAKYQPTSSQVRVDYGTGSYADYCCMLVDHPKDFPEDQKIPCTIASVMNHQCVDAPLKYETVEIDMGSGVKLNMPIVMSVRDQTLRDGQEMCCDYGEEYVVYGTTYDQYKTTKRTWADKTWTPRTNMIWCACKYCEKLPEDESRSMIIVSNPISQADQKNPVALNPITTRRSNTETPPIQLVEPPRELTLNTFNADTPRPKGWFDDFTQETIVKFYDEYVRKNWEDNMVFVELSKGGQLSNSLSKLGVPCLFLYEKTGQILPTPPGGMLQHTQLIDGGLPPLDWLTERPICMCITECKVEIVNELCKSFRKNVKMLMILSTYWQVKTLDTKWSMQGDIMILGSRKGFSTVENSYRIFLRKKSQEGAAAASRQKR